MRIEIKDMFLFLGLAVALFSALMFAVGYSYGRLTGFTAGIAYSGGGK